MTVSSSSQLTILNKVAVMNKCPLKMDLVSEVETVIISLVELKIKLQQTTTVATITATTANAETTTTRCINCQNCRKGFRLRAHIEILENRLRDTRVERNN
ncbi:8591_t:CDS:2 [Gigaspora rosea]|nr:8591_t:CDS:2 [Gigaspora rosea]